MSRARLAVVFAKPGFFITDMRLVVTLDGEPLHDGTFVGGFVATREIPAGAHELRTSIGIGALTRKRSYTISVRDGEEVTARLVYSRLWGNFENRLNVGEGIAAETTTAAAASASAVTSTAAGAAELGAFEQLLRTMTPRVLVTPILVLVNLVVFGVMAARGVGILEPTVQGLLDWGANYGPRVSAGEGWRLASSMFIHIGIIHLALNMAVLADAGRRIERMFGNVPFLALYLASGLVGSIASVAVHPYTVSAGASGAIFGIFGGFAALLVRQRGSIAPGVLARLRTGAVTFVLYNVVYGLSRQGIDMAAHLGGLAGGFAAGLALARPIAEGARPRFAAAFGAIAVALAATAGTIRVLPKYPDFVGEVDAFARVESGVLDAYNGAIRKAQANEIDDAQFAEILERDVLPPWRGARARLAALNGLERDQLTRRDLLLTYMDAREAGWQMLDGGLHAHDPDAYRRATDKQREAERALEQLKALNRDKR